jgi:predicted nucleic-acid-binding protein
LIGLDTGVLVRYFARDDRVQSARATRLLHDELSAGQPGFVSLVTLAETAWVLRSRYKATRDEVVTAVEALLTAPNVVLQDEDAVWLALDDCQAAGVGVADALIAAIGRHHGCTHSVTFDAQALRIPDMHRLR